MSWQAHLDLRYSQQDGATGLHHRHEGPLRVMRSWYPEGPAVCHNVVVHPPGGLVEGDVLSITIDVASGAHALLSTPGATRFYGSQSSQVSQQSVQATVGAGARLEWLPLESIAYPDCRAENTLDVDIEEGGTMMAWDITALGLPQADQPFESGEFRQRMRVNGDWLESGLINGADSLFMDSALGLDGQRCMGTLIWASGSLIDPSVQADWLSEVRASLPSKLKPVAAGATWPNDHVLVVRALGPMVEPVMAVLQSVWAVLRRVAWQMTGVPPRIWRV